MVRHRRAARHPPRDDPRQVRQSLSANTFQPCPCSLLRCGRYPQIKDLYGYDPDQKWQTLACVHVWLCAGEVWLICVCRYIVIQMFLAWYLRDSDGRTLLLVAYGVGGLINHALSLAVHVCVCVCVCVCV